MAETPAQRAARERNLRKGNPRSYSNPPAEGAPRETAEDGRGSAEGAPRAPEGQTFKARPRSAEKAPRKPRAAPRARPRAAEGEQSTSAEGAPRAAPAKGGGFLSGLLDGLR